MNKKEVFYEMPLRGNMFIDPLLNELIRDHGIRFLKVRYDKWYNELQKIIIEAPLERASLLSDLLSHIKVVKDEIDKKAGEI